MDSQQPRTDLKTILKETGYFVEFCGGENESWINVNMEPHASGKYLVKYDPDSEVLVNTFNHRSVKCPPSAVNPITKSLLKQICRSLQFPEKRVIFNYGTSPTTSLKQKISNANREKELTVEEIMDDIRISGIDASHFDLAESFGVKAEFESYCEFILGRGLK